MDEELKASTVVRAAQRPTTMMWVPLDVFIVEAFVVLLAVRFFNLWALILTPLHLPLVLLTAQDPFWTRTLTYAFFHYVSVGNRGLRGKGVTFSAKFIRTPTKTHDLPE